MITETDQVAQALDDASRRWPEERDNRPRLLLRLLQEGHRAVTVERRHLADDRRRAVAETSGVLTGVYGDNYLDDLRADWPE